MLKQYELDLIAAWYDEHGDSYTAQRINSGMLFNDYIEAPIVRELLGKPSLIKDTNALDIGCGPGIYSSYLLGAGANLTALDSSNLMLETARKLCFNNLSEEIMKKANFLHTSFEDANLKDAKFNIILATFMISYFKDLDTAFKKMKDHLAPKGKIITSILHPMKMLNSKHRKKEFNYFNGGIYESDFLHKGIPIPLKRYNFEQIFNSFDRAGLKLIKLHEPSVHSNCSYPNQEKVKFYTTHPSIVIFQLGFK